MPSNAFIYDATSRLTRAIAWHVRALMPHGVRQGDAVRQSEPADIVLHGFVWMSERRWAIEQCFEERKFDVGMDHDEVRTYEGWREERRAGFLASLALIEFSAELLYTTL